MTRFAACSNRSVEGAPLFSARENLQGEIAELSESVIVGHGLQLTRCSEECSDIASKQA